jgi:hypothetical protein
MLSKQKKEDNFSTSEEVDEVLLEPVVRDQSNLVGKTCGRRRQIRGVMFIYAPPHTVGLVPIW